jgi:hypothetical protein
MLTKLGLATIVAPSTSGWSGARDAIHEYVEEQEQKRRRALGLDGLIEAARRDAEPAAAGHGVKS